MNSTKLSTSAIVASVLFTTLLVCTGSASPPDRPSLRTEIDDLLSKIEELEKSGDSTRADELKRTLEKALLDVKSQLAPKAINATWRQNQFQYIVADTRQLLTELSASSGVLATEYSDRLTRLESAMKAGEIHLRQDEKPIVQWLHLQSSSSDISTAKVDVHVDIESRPVVLVLSSNRPTVWKLAQKSAARVEAVILLGETDELQSEEEVLLFHRLRPITELDPKTRDIVSNFIAFQVGQRPTSILQVHDADSPINLGPTQTDWVRAYVLGEAASLKEEVRAQVNESFAAKHEDLTFHALTTTQQIRGRSRAVADYTLRGPNLESQRPLGGSYWNPTSTSDGTEYCLHRHGLKTKTQGEWVQVNRPPTMQRNTRFLALTYDTKRNRLLILDREHTVHAMNCETREWTSVAKVNGAVAMKWTSNDELVAVVQSPQDAQETRYRTEVVFLDSNFQPLRKLDTACSARLLGTYESSSNELCLTDEFLIAVQPASGVLHHEPAQTTIRAFDLNTGTMRFEHRPPALSSGHQSVSWLKHGDRTRLVVLRDRLRAAHISVQRIGPGHAKERETLMEQIEEVRNPVAFSRSTKDSPSVQWIRSYSQRTPVVRVTDKSGPLILAISSFSAREWRLEFASDVDLRKVILTCDEIQPTLTGLPSGVEVAVHSRNDVLPKDLAINRQDFYLRSVIEKLAGTEITSELDLNLFRKNTIAIGPRDGDWVVDQNLKRLDKIILSASRLREGSSLPEDFRFSYEYIGELPGVRSAPSITHSPHSQFITECDYRGPILNTFLSLDPQQVTPNRTTKGAGNTIIVGDHRSGFKELKPNEENVEVVSIKGGPTRGIRELMFDTANSRTFCVADDLLHVHNSDGWTARKLPALSTEAWCFDSTNQRFHAIVRQALQLTEVFEVSTAGAILRQRSLPVPIACEFGLQRRLCSIYGNSEHLIIVLQPKEHRESKYNKIYVLDLSDLSILYQGAFEPHVQYEPVDEQLFQRLWAKLASSDDHTAERAMWRLAAGLSDTTRQIEEKLGVKSMTQEETQSCIRQLDADTFNQRDAAYQALAASLLTIRPELQASLADDQLSREQKLRLSRLLEQVTNPLQERATAVLRLIESQSRHLN